MIVSFKHAGLEKFFKKDSKAGIIPAHAKKIRNQLSLLDVATKPSDLDKSGWGLHPLGGKLAGHWAISVNGNWRITFRFTGVDVEVVDYQDYHYEDLCRCITLHIPVRFCANIWATNSP
jgi:toxin HigB-1